MKMRESGSKPIYLIPILFVFQTVPARRTRDYFTTQTTIPYLELDCTLFKSTLLPILNGSQWLTCSTLPLLLCVLNFRLEPFCDNYLGSTLTREQLLNKQMNWRQYDPITKGISNVSSLIPHTSNLTQSRSHPQRSFGRHLGWAIEIFTVGGQFGAS